MGMLASRFGVTTLSNSISKKIFRSFSSTTIKMAPIAVGDSVPSIDLFEGAPDKKVNLAEECKSGKHVIFGVPGAFTPGCSKTHLPGYVSKAEELKGRVYPKFSVSPSTIHLLWQLGVKIKMLVEKLAFWLIRVEISPKLLTWNLIWLKF